MWMTSQQITLITGPHFLAIHYSLCTILAASVCTVYYNVWWEDLLESDNLIDENGDAEIFVTEVPEKYVACSVNFPFRIEGLAQILQGSDVTLSMIFQELNSSFCEM
jgi:hypothetical protein